MGNTTTLPVVEEQLLARLDEALGEDTDAVIAVDHHDFGVAVGVDRVVGEADLVSLARCVHHEIWRNKNGRTTKNRSVSRRPQLQRMEDVPLFKLKRKEHMYLS